MLIVLTRLTEGGEGEGGGRRRREQGRACVRVIERDACLSSPVTSNVEILSEMIAYLKD